MKLILALCVLSVAVTCLEAAPQRLEWETLVPARRTEQRLKGFGEIWSNCSKSTDPAKIISVKISPDPPVKGKDVTVTAEFELDEQVTGGEITAKIKWGFIPIPIPTEKVCDVAKEAGLSCPIAKGDRTVTITRPIPGIIPSGHITGTVEVTDQGGNELACVKLDLHL